MLRMATDVRIHFGLEAIGALGLRCVIAWSALGLLTSWLTVNAVG